jgi:hypothetical protein
MNQHLAKAIAKYEEAGTKFTEIFNWHLCYGIVLCHHDYFAMAYFCDSSDPETSVLTHHADTLFATFIIGNMRKALDHFKGQFDFIAYQRSFKNSDRIRLLDMEYFYSKLR